MQANRLAELMQGSPWKKSATVRNGAVLRLTCLYSASRSRSEAQGFDSLGSTVLVLPQSADKTRQILPAFGF
jgi:hypothetical protein